jgi:MioC protein
MNIMILFGTESGNAELISSEISEAINGRYTVAMRDMSDVDPAELSRDDFHLVVCSTHGEGELPSGAVPFAIALMGAKPDLRGLRYAMFGLGDSSYDNYSRGSDVVDELLRAHGAKRHGPFGRYDASSQDDAIQLGKEWANGVLKDLLGVQTSDIGKNR